jgi:hypothetical protein
MDLGFLNRSNAAAAAEILLDFRTDQPLILVFDNFQFAVSNWQPQVIDALAKRPPDGFRWMCSVQRKAGKIPMPRWMSRWILIRQVWRFLGRIPE